MTSCWLNMRGVVALHLCRARLRPINTVFVGAVLTSVFLKYRIFVSASEIPTFYVVYPKAGDNCK